MTILPTERTPASLDFLKAKVLLYGRAKIGKSSLAVGVDPDVIVLACEPGLGGLSAYSVEITKWQDFLDAANELYKNPDKFSIVVLDTVDELWAMCTEHVCEQHGVKHPSEGEWGIVYDAIKSEFRSKVGKLAAMGRGTWYVSHAVDKEVESRIGKRTVTAPTLAPRGLDFISGFVDFILLARSEQTEEGENRVLRTKSTENYEAGGRYTLTDPLPLDAKALRADIERASKQGEKK